MKEDNRTRHPEQRESLPRSRAIGIGGSPIVEEMLHCVTNDRIH